jgi:hypothetical protein
MSLDAGGGAVFREDAFYLSGLIVNLGEYEGSVRGHFPNQNLNHRPHTRSVKIPDTTFFPAIATASLATMFVWRNTGRADRQMHASVDPFQEHRNDCWHVDDNERIDSPTIPTAVSIPSRSGTTSSVLRVTQTSTMGLRTSRRWGAGSRESREDARVPRRRPSTGMAEKRRMWTEVLAHKGI